MNTKKVVMAAAALIIIAIIGNTAMFLAGKSPVAVAGVYEEKSLSAEGINKIQVKTKVGDVDFIQYDGEEIQVRLDGKSSQKRKGKERLTVEAVGNAAIIRADSELSRKFFSIGVQSYHMKIKVPKKIWKSIDMDVKTGDILIDGIEAGKIRMRSTVGDIEGKNLAGEIECRTEAGDIDLGMLKIEKDIRAVSEVGDITIKTKEIPAALQTDLRSSVGDENISLPGVEHNFIGTGGPLVKATSDVGDISLEMD